MRFTTLLLLSCLVFINAFAQETATKKTTLTLATLYSSNVSYYGQSTEEKLPYVLANATLRFPMGVYLSAGSYKLLNYGSGLSETDLGAGFDYEFNDQLSTGISFVRSFFPANSPLLQASNGNNVNISASYIWPWLKSSISADYAFGRQADLFLSLSQSKEISIGSLFSEKNSLFIEPSFELIAGSSHFYETYIIEQVNRNNANGKGNGKGKNPKNIGELPVEPITTTTSSSNFNLLAYNFRLPVNLSRANWIAEISYQLTFPGPKTAAELQHQQSIISLAFYYQF